MLIVMIESYLGIRKGISKYYLDRKLQKVETIREFMEKWK